jgi:syntaxin 6|tara:strand:+ start:208 stop:882 length:675 start_codon:yes stop_codon:yes gene_type:complete
MGDVNDPFYLVKEEIQLSVDKAKAVTERMDRLPEHNGERARYANEIVTECDSVVWQLEELNRATGMAERDFVRFRVDANELSSRKRWTSVTKDAVVAMRGNARRVVDGAAEKQKRAGGQNSNHFAAGASASDQSTQNDHYLDDHNQQQQHMLRSQDVDLEDISVSIRRIGQVGLTIGEELATQGKMLEDLEQVRPCAFPNPRTVYCTAPTRLFTECLTGNSYQY